MRKSIVVLIVAVLAVAAGAVVLSLIIYLRAGL